MRVSTTIRAQIDAAHIGPFHDRIHGHTWMIEARFPVEGALPRDAGEIHAELMSVLAKLDHSTLDDVLGSGHATSEGIAQYVLECLDGCDRVRVWRAGAQAGAEAEH